MDENCKREEGRRKSEGEKLDGKTVERRKRGRKGEMGNKIK